MGSSAMSKQDGVYNTCLAFIIVVGIFMSGRIYTRLFIVKAFGADDVCSILASMSNIVGCSLILVATRYGLGLHITSLKSIEDGYTLIKITYSVTILYTLAVTLAKLSIVITYLRIFLSKTFKWIMYGTSAIIVCMAIILITVSLAFHWDWLLNNHKVAVALRLNYAFSGLNAMTDLILCIAPIPWFWKLQMPIREKIIISTLFTVGIFAFVASILRLFTIHYLSSLDVTWNICDCLIWSVVEGSVGVICASVPSLKPLIKTIWPGRLFSTNASKVGTSSTLTDRGRAAKKSLGSERLGSAPSSPGRIGFGKDSSVIKLQPYLAHKSSTSGGMESDEDELFNGRAVDAESR